MPVEVPTTMRARWIRRFRPVADPRVRLVCFPHAGGAASAFRSWPDRLPADVDLLAVCYPGRQDRFQEPCVTRMGDLVDPIAQVLAELTGPPLALFGHSMGASVAFEVARRLEPAGRPQISHLFLSGREAPQLTRLDDTYRAEDEKIIADVRRLGGYDPAIFADPGLLELVLPPIRADYEVVGTYQPPLGVTVAAPIVAYVGDADPEVSAEDACGWAESTRGSFDHRVFPGDHFYLGPQEAALVADLSARL